MCVSSALVQPAAFHQGRLSARFASADCHNITTAQHTTHTEDVCGRRESKSTFHARRDSSAGIIRIPRVELILICLGEAKNAKAAAGDLIAKV